MLRYTASIIWIAAAALLQTTNLIFIGQVKPNLVLAFLAVLAHFHKDWVERVTLVLVPALILKFSPVVIWEDVIFTVTALLVVALAEYMPWRRVINSAFALIIGTIIINLRAFDAATFFTELTYNLTLAILFFIIIDWAYGKAKK